MTADLLVALQQQAAGPDRTAFIDPAGSITWRGLAQRISGAAMALLRLPDPVGLLAPSSIDWLVADLAGWATDKTIVPLPHFFSDAQLEHIVRDAGIRAVMADDQHRIRMIGTGIPLFPLPTATGAPLSGEMAGRRIVYTSGSTGSPKGAILGPAQIRTSCAALMNTTGASGADRHLSALPFSLLLEAICGIYLPVLAGGTGVIEPGIVAAAGAEVATRLGEAAMRHRPTTMVLVPQLLQAWVMAASVGRVEIPDSLRFVATGGAAVPATLAARAWELGIPVHEGYGLTECGSVVAVNAPGQRRAGTVGRCLPGYKVQIAPDSEIVVASGSVAHGYLNRSDGPADGIWHTGDIGSIDDDGYLTVTGRKDNLIVTANGRNLSPEWIETMLLADPRLARAVVLRAADGQLAAVAEPSVLGTFWARHVTRESLRKLVDGLMASAPGYAMPRHLKLLQPDELPSRGLLTANGKPRRREIAAAYADSFTSLDETETRHAVL